MAERLEFVALLASLQYLFHFFPPVAQHDVFNIGHVNGVRHNGNLVDVRVALKGVDGVFDDHLAGHLEKLFGCAQAQTAANAAGQHNGYVANHIREECCYFTKQVFVACLFFEFE